MDKKMVCLGFFSGFVAVLFLGRGSPGQPYALGKDLPEINRRLKLQVHSSILALEWKVLSTVVRAPAPLP
jgi:hypothetical protein